MKKTLALTIIFAKNIALVSTLLFIIFYASSCSERSETINSPVNNASLTEIPLPFIQIYVYQYGNCGVRQPGAKVKIKDSATGEILSEGTTDAYGFFYGHASPGTVYYIIITYDGKIESTCLFTMPGTDAEHHICITNRKC